MSYLGIVLTQPTTIGAGDVTYDGQNVFIIGTTVTIDGHHDFGSVWVLNNGVLTDSAGSILDFSAIDLTVDASSRLSVDGKGTRGRRAGRRRRPWDSAAGGGGHGGAGGYGYHWSGSSASGGPAYDYPLNPGADGFWAAGPLAARPARRWRGDAHHCLRHARERRSDHRPRWGRLRRLFGQRREAAERAGRSG